MTVQTIKILYSFKNSPAVWTVLRRYNNGWLCSLDSNPKVKNVISDKAVAFGKARYNSSQVSEKSVSS